MDKNTTLFWYSITTFLLGVVAFSLIINMASRHAPGMIASAVGVVVLLNSMVNLRRKL